MGGGAAAKSKTLGAAQTREERSPSTRFDFRLHPIMASIKFNRWQFATG